MSVATSIRRENGDTLIEVLFATAVFSLIAVGGLSIMNQGLAASQRSLEITLVRNEMDAQAEALRFLNSSYISVYQPGLTNYGTNTPASRWKNNIPNFVSTIKASELAVAGNKCPSSENDLRDKSFVINTKYGTFVQLTATNFKSANTYSEIEYDVNNQVVSSNGIWIEAVNSELGMDAFQSNTRYIDFHIRACWDSPGQLVPVTLGTIVRLYEPL